MIGRLNAKKAKEAKPGKLCDGGGLGLYTGQKSKSWVFRYMIAGKAVEMGIGSYDDLGLGEAREAARKRPRPRLRAEYLLLQYSGRKLRRRVKGPLQVYPLGNQVPHLLIRQGIVVTDDIRLCAQKVFDALALRRVITGVVIRRDGPFQNGIDPHPDPARGLGLLVPNGLQRPDDIANA